MIRLMRRSRGARGSLLIISLWLITILSVLAVAIARYLSTEVRLARYRLSRERAAALARSGVYVGLELLKQDAARPEAGGQTYDWLGDEWARPGASGLDEQIWVAEWPLDPAAPLRATARVAVTIEDEERKLNVHSVPSDPDDPQFKALEALLVSRDAAVALVDWLDEDEAPLEPTRPDTEAVEATNWRAKNAPAARLEELFTIPGLRDVDRAAVQRFLSPYYGPTAKPNLNTVAPEVLSALGLPALAGSIIACRQRGLTFDGGTDTLQKADECLGSDGALPSEERGPVQALFGIASDTFTIVSEGTLIETDGRGQPRPPVRVKVEAVVRRTECEPAAPPCIVAWSS